MTSIKKKSNLQMLQRTFSQGSAPELVCTEKQSGKKTQTTTHKLSNEFHH